MASLWIRPSATRPVPAILLNTIIARSYIVAIDENDLPRMRHNFVAVRALPPETAELERKLQNTKWFDYRFISPLEATEKFVQAYSSAYEYYYGVMFSSSRAGGKTGIRQRSWKSSSREFNSAWKARQFADELGVPYDQFAFPVMELSNRQGWQNVPRPNQIYGQKMRPAVTAYVGERWLEYTKSARLMFSELPQYKTENFVGLPAQIHHQNWVVAQLKTHHGDHVKMAALCFEYQVLPVDRAIVEFGLEQFVRAKKYADDAGLLAVPVPSPSDAETRPSCYGLPNAYDDASIECSDCPLQASCFQATLFVKGRLVVHTGSEDPRAGRRREQVRDRVRRHRAKAKAAARSPSLLTSTSLALRFVSRNR